MINQPKDVFGSNATFFVLTETLTLLIGLDANHRFISINMKVLLGVYQFV